MYIYETINLARKIEKDMNEHLKDYGITFLQWQLLRTLYLSDTSCMSASAVSKDVSKDKRLVSISFKKLEDLHYIQRVISDDDKRGKFVSITDNGLATCETIYEYEEFYNEEMLLQRT